jgi:RNA polymerase sigma-70 factor (ECF subfamily)
MSHRTKQAMTSEVRQDSRVDNSRYGRDLALGDEDQKSLFMNWLGEHGASVMKVARAYTLTSEECQDLAQEILLQAWRSLPKFEGKASAATWFYRVALHTAMKWHRNDKPRRLRQQPLLELQVVATEGANSAEQAQHRETVEQLYKAIHQLPKTDAALVLLYLDDLSYPEMAEVLGISESNVGVKLNRAKKALGELMKGQSHES